MKNTIQHRAIKPFAFPSSNKNVGIMIKVGKNTTEKIEIIFGDPMGGWVQNNWNKTIKIMNLTGTTSFHDVFECNISDKSKRLRYAFKISPKRGKSFLYGEIGVFNDINQIQKEGYGFTYNYWNKNQLLNTPKWFKETSWYQIFPDRFAKHGKNKINQPNWNDLPKEHEIYGGNLKGITLKLDHIKNLGFKGIYLTPIFAAKTSHRYETNDYYKIDALLGSEDDFKTLIKELHKRGMKIMLDGVFNHIGYHSKQFQDVIKNKRKSKYKDWFWINDFSKLKQAEKYNRQTFDKEYPYETFAMVPEMPRINWGNNDAKEFLIRAAEKWTRLGIDGWRLDVSFEPPIEFWREFNKRIKKIKNDIAIIGEVWWDSLTFLEHDVWHGIMNYPLRKEIIEYVKSKQTLRDKQKFVARFNDLSFSYTPEQQWGMFNLISSHDTERFITTIKHNDKKYKLAMSLCYLQPGAPSTYYGEEIGLEGQNDPDNRRTYPWKDNLKKYFGFFKEINKIRLNFIKTSDIFSRYIAKLKNNKIILENSNNKIIVDGYKVIREQK